MLRPVKALYAALLTLLASIAFAAEEPHYPVMPLGTAAPDFDLPGADSRNWKLGDFADSRILAIVFTCTHCPTAQNYEERLKQLVRDYHGKGVGIVAISPNSPAGVRADELGFTDVGDTLDDMKIRAKHHEFNFPFLYDGETEALSQKFGPVATPHVFIFDQQRRLRFRGRIDDNERLDLVKTQDMRNALDALLADKEPPVAQTKVFGCSTKWADKAAANQTWLAKVHAEPVTVELADVAAIKAIRANQGTGKLRLINVWSTTCPPCVAEFDDLVDTNLRFRHRDFELVTISGNAPDEKGIVLKFLKKHFASTKNLLFAQSEQEKLIEAIDPEWEGGLPYTLLVAPDGKVIYRHQGDLDFLELRRKIVPALNAITAWPGMKTPG